MRILGTLCIAIILSLLVFFGTDTVAFAQDPTNDFWKRYNQVYDIGKNYLDDTARGSGRVSAHHGAYNYRYDFPLPPGRNGMAPNLALVYSSQGGRSYLGEGWSWNIPYIERSTKYGLPSYIDVGDGADQFDYHDENGAVHHLIPVEHQGDHVYYRYMSESEFSWFKYNTSTKIWTVLRKDGHILQFGSRYSGAATYAHERGYTAWYLNEDLDKTGNTIKYTYNDSYDRFVVPSEITYTGNRYKEGNQGWEPAVKIQFKYTPGDENMLNCRTGECYYEDVFQLERIDVKVRNWDRKQYSFRYKPIDHHKVLHQIEVRAYGRDGNWTDLPPVTFTYEASTPAFTRRNISFPSGDPQPPFWEHSESRVDSPLVRTLRTLADMNGDGVKDLVVAHEPYMGEFCQYKIYFGDVSGKEPGDLRFSTPVFWPTPQWTPLYGGHHPCHIRMNYNSSVLTRKHTDLVDITGDGLPDFIAAIPNESGQNVLVVARNSGNGLDLTPEVWEFPPDLNVKEIFYEEPFSYFPAHRDVRIMLVDMNGDGLPDIVDCHSWTDDDRYCHVFLNRSDGFDETPIRWASPIHAINIQFIDERGEVALGLVELSDMNGDGLIDLVMQPDWGSWDDEIRVYLNIGDGFSSSPFGINWNIPGPTHYVFLNKISTDPYLAERLGRKFLVDLNSDGLPDLLFLRSEDQGQTHKWVFYQNLGNRFSSEVIELEGLWSGLSIDHTMTRRETTTPKISNTYSMSKLIDIDGDGRVDLIHPQPYYDDLDEEYDHFGSYMGNYRPGLKLIKVENGYGGSVDVGYTPTSRTTNPHLPSVSNVVSWVETFNGIDNRHRVIYDYEDGLIDSFPEDFFHPANKEYRGFAIVRETDSARDLLLEHRFHQDAYRDGFLRNESHSRESNGKLIRQKSITYREKPINLYPLWSWPSVLFYYPEDIETSVCNEAPQCTTVSIFQQFDSDGNIIQRDEPVAQQNSQPEPEEDRRFFWTYKKKDDRANNIYIFALERSSQISWSGNDKGWVQNNETLFYHDGSRDLDYISQGLLTTVRSYSTDTAYHESKRRYDTESGLLLSETDFNGNETTYTYDLFTNSYIATKAKGGLKEEFGWDFATGQNIRYRDLNGVLWNYNYDGFGRPLGESYQASSEPPIEVKRIKYHDKWYLAYGLPVWIEEITTIDNDQSLFANQRTYYNGLGNKIQERELHRPNWIVRFFGYDTAGRLQKVSIPMFRNAGYTDPDWTHYSAIRYDPLDRVTEIRRPCNSSSVRTFAFGGDLSTTMIDEEGNKLSTLTDGHGNIIEVARYDAGGSPVRSLFEYDGHDNIIKAIDHLGNEINYERDWHGRIKSVKLSGFPEGRAWTFDYDGNGNLTRFLSPEGREISYSYDELDRLLGREFKLNGNSDGSVEYRYDRTTSYGKGRLTWAQSAGGTAEYFYDPRGNVIEYWTKNEVSGREYELTFTYNEADAIKTLTYPDGSVFHYTYNPDGTVKALVRRVNGSVYAEATYNARRQVASIATDFGVEYSYSYDLCGRPTGIQSTSSNGEIMNRSISHYANDKIRTIHDREEVGSGEPTVLHYDELLRLESAAGEAYAVSYKYDRVDRLNQMDRDGQTVEYLYEDTRFPWAVTSINGNPGITDYSYDDDGIIKSEVTRFAETTDFTFNARGLIKSVNTSTESGFPSGGINWEYDHLDRPIHAKYTSPCLLPGCSATDYVDKYYENQWVQPGLYRTTKFLFFAGRRLAGLVKEPFPEGTAVPETLYYFHSDQIGSIRYVTDSTGEVVDTHHYYPYGEEYHTSSSTEVDFRFNDRKNVGYGLYRFPMRMYSPSTHQWTSLDQMVLGTPFVLVSDGVNPYAYCGNDPINRYDPTGGQMNIVDPSYDPGFVINRIRNKVDDLIRPISKPKAMLIDPHSEDFQTMQAMQSVVSAAVSEAASAVEAAVGGVAEVHNLSQQIATGQNQEAKETATELVKKYWWVAVLAVLADKDNDPPQIPDDPSTAPGPDWEWRGGDKGQWFNPKTGESLRPDLDHLDPIGPHWDYKKRGESKGWRIFPDGRVEPKK
jgi:RHS repeat-associated protein